MVPIYNVELFVSYGDDLEFLEKSWNDQPKMDSEIQKLCIECMQDLFQNRQTTGARYNYYQSKDIHYIHLFEKKDLSIFMNHLIHELSHATFEILRSRGMKYSSKSEEAYTYLIGYITQEVIQKFQE